MIKIAIEKDTTAEGVAPDYKKEGAVEPGKVSTQQRAVNTALIGAGKQVLSQGIKQYGNITGDYAMVNAIDNVISIGSDVAMIAVGGVVGIIAVVAKHGLQAANLAITTMQSNRNIDLVRERAGLISVKGSRYQNE
jgi:hypothetical protein